MSLKELELEAEQLISTAVLVLTIEEYEQFAETVRDLL